MSTDTQDYLFTTEGDCCSETWFADITGVRGLLGQVVTKVDHIDMPDAEDDRSRQEVDRQYGIRLTTSKATVDIVYRNSSNGYYGGGYSLLEPPYARRLDDFRPITEDWRA